MSADPHADFTLASLARVVGQTSYGRGVRYARSGAVAGIDWYPDELRAIGTVEGTGSYQAIANFQRFGEEIEFTFGQCSCPVRMNCKHVVALTVVLVESALDEAESGPDWEAILDSALPEDHTPAGTMPLGVQLSLMRGPRSDRWGMAARLVRPGKAGWVNGNMTWSGLGHVPEADPRQVLLLSELWSTYQVGRRGYYGYGNEKDIDLTSVMPERLWTLIDEMYDAGVEFVHTRKEMGTIPRPARAELVVDLSRSDRGLDVTPTIHVDDSDLPVSVLGFFGSDPHGVLYLPSDEPRKPEPDRWPFRMARLTGRAPRAMQDLIIGNESVTVPPEDTTRFTSEYFPRLQRAAAVRSSSDDFTPPTVEGPGLVLDVAYSEGHRADVTWWMSYRIDGVERLAALDGPLHEAFRSEERERALLAGLDAPLDQYGLRREGVDRPYPRVTLHGLDTARVAGELLPLLESRDDVEVRVSGSPADYRDAGESLQIGVGTDATDDGDWFDLEITVRVEGQPVPFKDVFTALSAGDSHLLLPDGAYLSLDKPELQRLKALITEARDMHDQDPNQLRLSRFQAGVWEELAALGVVERQAEQWRVQVQGLLDLTETADLEPPSTLRATLRPYQLDGFRWLAFLWTNRLGGILADDMGLGKTVQSLALICHARQTKSSAEPVLIVAPTSVVPNWASEAQRFAPHLKVVAMSETSAKRGAALGESIEGADVVITSYTLARLDADEYESYRWSMLLLDEAQFVKNHRSKAYQAMRRIDAPTKIAISGTPLENTLMELWSLLSITAPGLFPHPTKFQEFYRTPIEKSGDTELLAQLRRRIRPLMLRRTKEQVAADLPEKQEQVLEVELSPQHRKLYDTRLQRERQKILGLVDDLDSNRFTILQSLTVLRQLSLDPALVDDTHRTVGSAKIDALIEQLEDVVAGGHRALVFSQFTGFLDRVRTRLDAENIAHSYLDGRTRGRAQVLDEFKSGDAPVFLISLKAGGFGLNLTEADYCFLLDPWWNPATEAQAVDRTHRIGQTRNVMVYRLIAKDTIEEKVMTLKGRKSELFSSVVDEGGAFSSSLSAEDIRELLN
ncbi:SNF2-related protein [Rhodococcus sp. Q]|uniref:DEAD/DEAH box helicase n=1 Tax=Rhodococcus sp. Q TaxID=2502252 RepID=UPI0010F4F451|nr:SNF2-related protein [Rhodococcus sp. Q]